MNEQNLKIIGFVVRDVTAIILIAWLANTAMTVGIDGILYKTSIGAILGIAIGLTGKELVEIIRNKKMKPNKREEI